MRPCSSHHRKGPRHADDSGFILSEVYLLPARFPSLVTPAVGPGIPPRANGETVQTVTGLGCAARNAQNAAGQGTELRRPCDLLLLSGMACCTPQKSVLGGRQGRVLVAARNQPPTHGFARNGRGASIATGWGLDTAGLDRTGEGRLILCD